MPGLAFHLEATLEGNQAQRGQGQRRLARAGFTNDAQGLAAAQFEIGTVQGGERAAPKPTAPTWAWHRVMHLQASGLQQDRRVRHRLEHIALGLAVHQALGVGVLRLAQHLGHRALLDHQTVFHHHHALGKTAHHVQVVGDEQHRHVVFGLQAVEQGQYLPAQRHVQGGGGLVSQQQFGFTGQCHGDHGALALAA